MAILAAMVHDHPLAKQWAQGGIDEVNRELRDWATPGGGWIEAPHYQTVAMSSILLLAFSAKNAGFADYLNDPRLLGAMRYLAHINTPPDPRCDNKRHLPAAGNTYQFETTGLFGIMAKACREKNPALADELQWAWIQEGKPRVGMVGDQGSYSEFQPAGSPTWGSEQFPGSGAVLRSAFPSDRENYLYLLQGYFFEHYNFDRGSFELWGKGRPLCLFWGYSLKMGRTPAWLQNQVDIGGIGKIEEFACAKPADYLRSKQGPWDRQIVHVKDTDPLAPAYFVMRDSLSQGNANWWLWLYTEHSPELVGDVVRVDGVDDVDLDVWLAPNAVKGLKTGKPCLNRKETIVLATPSSSFEQSEKKGQNDLADELVKEVSAPAPATPKGTWVQTQAQTLDCFDMSTSTQRPLTQEGLTLPLKAEEPIFCVLYPRLKTQKPATFTAIADGRGVKVTHGNGVDYVFLAAAPFEFREGNVSFKGVAGVIRSRQRSVDLTLGAGGEISLGDNRLSSDKAATRSFPNR